MAFASFDGHDGRGDGREGPFAEINLLPLIDVMLVLLVIFIVAAPLLTHAVKLDLPRADAPPAPAAAARIDFAIDASGALFWNAEAVTRDAAAARFTAAGRLDPRPELQLRADETVAYREIARTLADASRAGLTRIGFVTEPAAR